MYAGIRRNGGNGQYGFEPPPSSVRQRFTGYERDNETGLDFAQARYYSSIKGRFTSVDPLHSSAIPSDPQSWNRYSYVGNRPTIIVDPTGLAWGYFSGNGGNWYQWFDDEKDIEKNGGTLVKANAGAGFTYQSADGRWIRLDLSKNSWEAYDTSMQAFYGQREFPTAMGDLANTLDLIGVAQGVGGLARFGASALGRIFGSGSELAVLGLTETAVTTELRFTQTTASANFSAEGFFPEKTIGQVSNELRSGILNPSQVPVRYIEGEGVNLIFNTRSALSLMRAGIPRNQWNLVNVSGDAAVQANIAERLLRNGLTQQGTSTLRITGFRKTASSMR